MRFLFHQARLATTAIFIALGGVALLSDVIAIYRRWSITSSSVATSYCGLREMTISSLLCALGHLVSPC